MATYRRREGREHLKHLLPERPRTSCYVEPLPPIPPAAGADAARMLVAESRFGILSTQSQQHPGFPFGSLMLYAIDQDAAPVFFISSLAMHTRNLQANHHASLFIADPKAPGDLLESPRVTLLGPVNQVSSSDASHLYLARHANAKQWQDFSDFAYYRMEITSVYLIAGFGQMGWISPEDYRKACPAT